MTSRKTQLNAVVVGSGIAGLMAALELSKRGHNVSIVTKRKSADASTYYAQGGIAAVDPARLEKDSFELHMRDTLEAGAGLCNRKRVKFFVENAFTGVVKPLIEMGVDFSGKMAQSETGYPYLLHQEGGHSRERIYCVNDYTGRAVEEKLVELVMKDRNINLYENHMAIDLITKNRLTGETWKDVCLGVYVMDIVSEEVITFPSDVLFIATGGVGRVYLYTSNPDTSTGDGIAMAHRLGIEISDMEFMQFHPTCLYVPSPSTPSERRVLITEALRGKAVGAILTLSAESKEDFIKTLGYHKDGSASTRDIVARAIDYEMKKRGIEYVYLNATCEVTGKTEGEIRKGFPDIYRKCLDVGIDITKEPIPVVPAAHYTCGGIPVGERSETEIDGLYAIGECACTGIMGANRLASNSLPEAALYGLLAVEHACETGTTIKDTANKYKLPNWRTGEAVKSRDRVQVSQNWDETRRLMWNLVGIVRSEERLIMARNRIRLIKQEIRKYYWEYIITPDLLELRNIIDVAEIIVNAALRRKESIGTHFRLDYPN